MLDEKLVKELTLSLDPGASRFFYSQLVSNDQDNVLLGQVQANPHTELLDTPEKRFIYDIVKLDEAHEKKEREKTMVICDFHKENLELCLEMSKNYYGLGGNRLTLGVFIDIKDAPQVKSLIQKHSDVNFLWCFRGLTQKEDEDYLKELPLEIQERSLYMVDVDECKYNPFDTFFDKEGLVLSVNRNQLGLIPEDCSYTHLKYFPPEINAKSHSPLDIDSIIHLIDEALFSHYDLAE